MSRPHGPWTIKDSTEEYRDDFLALRVDRVIRPDGRPGKYSVVEVKPGVSILPIGADGTVHLVRQFRDALGAESVEVPCGGVEPGETPDAAARKELREELGLRADDWSDLGTIDLDTSMVRCKMSLFVARRLTLGAPEREATERIQSLQVPFDVAVRMVLDGAITHAASCVLILRAARSLNRRTLGSS